MFIQLFDRWFNRRSLIAVSFLLVLFVWSGGFKSGEAAEKIVYGLDWQVFGRHTGNFVALDKGFYKDEGLDVEIVRGYGSADAVKRVAAGNLTFSFGDTGSLVMARAEGIKVKAVAMIYGKAPYVLWFLKDANIKKPEDLYGKTIGTSAGSATGALFPAFAKMAKIDASKVKWQTVDATALYSMLFSKKIDAMVDFIPGKPTIEKRAKEAGLAIDGMLYADYGFNIYSNALLATEETISKKPDLVRKFVKATLMGWDNTFKNAEGGAAILKKYQPVLDEEAIRGEIDVVKNLAWTDEAKANGLGYMSAEKMKLTRDVITEMYKLSVTVPSEDLYTNQFLQK